MTNLEKFIEKETKKDVEAIGRLCDNKDCNSLGLEFILKTSLHALLAEIERTIKNAPAHYQRKQLLSLLHPSEPKED